MLVMHASQARLRGVDQGIKKLLRSKMNRRQMGQVHFHMSVRPICTFVLTEQLPKCVAVVNFMRLSLY